MHFSEEDCKSIKVHDFKDALPLSNSTETCLIDITVIVTQPISFDEIGFSQYKAHPYLNIDVTDGDYIPAQLVVEWTLHQASMVRKGDVIMLRKTTCVKTESGIVLGGLNAEFSFIVTRSAMYDLMHPPSLILRDGRYCKRMPNGHDFWNAVCLSFSRGLPYVNEFGFSPFI